jgi:NADH-quinone oxidoreductase subunit F
MVVCPPEYDAVRKVSPPDLVPVVERAPEKK